MSLAYSNGPASSYSLDPEEVKWVGVDARLVGLEDLRRPGSARPYQYALRARSSDVVSA